MQKLPKLLQGPVMCGSIFLILDFYGHNGARERTLLPVFSSLRG